MINSLGKFTIFVIQKRYIMNKILLLIVLSISMGCSKIEDRTYLIKTPKGEIKFKLYSETPKHQKNFDNLIEDGYFDRLLFHRVINDFMIQGGDPDSRDAEAGEKLGDGGPGYRISEEIKPTLFHKKGAIGAARESDKVNPLMESSGSQFYIVKGKIFTDAKLDKLEKKRIDQAISKLRTKIRAEYISKIEKAEKELNYEILSEISAEIDSLSKARVDSSRWIYPPKHREIYKTVGGTPHLDGNYTVFGEVTEGFEVIDSISAVKTDQFNLPIEKVTMEISIIE